MLGLSKDLPPLQGFPNLPCLPRHGQEAGLPGRKVGIRLPEGAGAAPGQLPPRPAAEYPCHGGRGGGSKTSRRKRQEFAHGRLTVRFYCLGSSKASLPSFALHTGTAGFLGPWPGVSSKIAWASKTHACDLQGSVWCQCDSVWRRFDMM